MSGIESITEKIIEDGQKTAKGILAEAKAQSKEKIDEANKKASDYFEKEKIEAEKEKAVIIERKLTVTDLEVRKVILTAKSEVISEVFSKLYKRLLELNDAEYKDFIQKLIENNADNGDAVILNAKDKKRIDNLFIEKIAKNKKIKISISDKTGDFSGGIILENKNIDKNITFETIVKLAREEFETDVNKILFN